MIGPLEYWGKVGPNADPIAIVEDSVLIGGRPNIVAPTNETSFAKPPRHMPFVFVPGEWWSTEEQSLWKQHELEDIARVGGNAFPSTTFFVTPNNTVRVPLSTDLRYLRYFNKSRLIPFGKTLPVESDEKRDAIIGTYRYNKKYVDEFVRSDNSSGFFIERHPFPHYLFAANKRSRLIVILGRMARDGVVLTAFQIPYGQVLFAPGNTIHTDTFSVGDIGVSFDPKEDEADSAFLRTPTGKNVQLYISQRRRTRPRH